MFTTRIPVLANTKLQVDVQPAFKIDPLDEDFTMITWHQEDRLAGDKEPEYEQHPAQPQPQPQPRRSARIKAMQTAALTKPKPPPNRQAESVPLGRSSLATLRDD